MSQSFYFLERISWIICSMELWVTCGDWKLEAASYMENKSFYWVHQFPQIFTKCLLNANSSLCLKKETDTGYFYTLRWLSNSSDQKRWAEASWNWLERQGIPGLEILGQPVTSSSSHPLSFCNILFHSNSLNFLTFTEYFCQINKKTCPLPARNS